MKQNKLMELTPDKWGLLVYLNEYDAVDLTMVKRCAGTPNRSRAAGHDVPALSNSVFIRNLKVSPIV